METLISKIHQLGVLPVIKIENADDAVPLAQAIIDGGLPAAEVTFRTAAAEQAIRNMVFAFPELLVGAGTVLSPEQAQTAINAGAKFIVSPGLNPAVVDFCLAQGVLIMPGIATPTELEVALGKGLKVVKFFPAGELGGLSYLKSMSAPYSGIQFIPTGGVDAGNLLDYLKFNKVLACGGSWMVKADLISAHRFDTITKLVAEAMQTILGFRLVNLRLKTPPAGQETAQHIFQDLLHLPVAIKSERTQVGQILELGQMEATGEVVIGTNSLERAIAFFERKGVSLKEVAKPDTKQLKLDLQVNGLDVVVEER